MKTFIPILCLIISIAQVNAQSSTCDCTKDLEFLNKKVKKTPAYKLNKTRYNNEFLKVVKEVENLDSGYTCFVALNSLLLSLNDNHSRLYGIDEGVTEDVKNDATKFDEFKSTKLFNIYPRPAINLDSLITSLESKPHDAIEGVYSRKDYMTLGVYQKPNDDTYQAIVLKSENKIWETGEILYTLIPFGNNYLLAVGGSVQSKRMVVHTERIDNGLFHTMGFQKDPSRPNYSVALHPESVYLREEISTDMTYIKIGSFSSWNPKLSQAEKFYKTLEGTLTTKNLIVDLRDNGGGGNRNSNLLLDILKEYLKKNNIYVLINNRTSSNAEQFAYKLSELNNCTTLGTRTNGTLAYEVVDANYNLPCGEFLTILTSKKHSKFIKLESVGLEPNVKLATETEWILQLKNYIKTMN